MKLVTLPVLVVAKLTKLKIVNSSPIQFKDILDILISLLKNYETVL